MIVVLLKPPKSSHLGHALLSMRTAAYGLLSPQVSATCGLSIDNISARAVCYGMPSSGCMKKRYTTYKNMNINDSNEVAIAIADVYNIANMLVENVSFRIEVMPKYNTLEVTFVDKRNDDINFLEYKYNKDLSVGLNGICLREFALNKNLI